MFSYESVLLYPPFEHLFFVDISQSQVYNISWHHGLISRFYLYKKISVERTTPQEPSGQLAFLTEPGMVISQNCPESAQLGFPSLESTTKIDITSRHRTLCSQIQPDGSIQSVAWLTFKRQRVCVRRDGIYDKCCMSAQLTPWHFKSHYSAELQRYGLNQAPKLMNRMSSYQQSQTFQWWQPVGPSVFFAFVLLLLLRASFLLRSLVWLQVNTGPCDCLSVVLY